MVILAVVVDLGPLTTHQARAVEGAAENGSLQSGRREFLDQPLHLHLLQHVAADRADLIIRLHSTHLLSIIFPSLDQENSQDEWDEDNPQPLPLPVVDGCRHSDHHPEQHHLAHGTPLQAADQPDQGDQQDQSIAASVTDDLLSPHLGQGLVPLLDQHLRFHDYLPSTSCMISSRCSYTSLICQRSRLSILCLLQGQLNV